MVYTQPSEVLLFLVWTELSVDGIKYFVGNEKIAFNFEIFCVVCYGFCSCFL